jgi:hypothetical protein
MYTFMQLVPHVDHVPTQSAGATVGISVGVAVGAGVGMTVGIGVGGNVVGMAVGNSVGAPVGSCVGAAVQASSPTAHCKITSCFNEQPTPTMRCILAHAIPHIVNSSSQGG